MRWTKKMKRGVEVERDKKGIEKECRSLEIGEGKGKISEKEKKERGKRRGRERDNLKGREEEDEGV